MKKLWHQFGCVILADGAANRLFDNDVSEGDDESAATENTEDPQHLFIPNAIIGDLDSIRDDVREYYRFLNICNACANRTLFY